MQHLLRPFEFYTDPSLKQRPLDDINLRRITRKIERFISDYVSKSLANGLVIGLSGGLDSSVVLKLAVNAIGRSKVIGVVMPSDTTPKEDTEHAIELATSLEVRHHIIGISPLLEKYAEILPVDKKAKGNLTARVRMNILYYYANIEGCIVAGTSDKSELQIGYFTKFGDGASDIMPIAELYKTQVRALAKFLGIREAIVEKKSSPRLWEGHLAEDEIGLDYGTIDSILPLLVDRKLKPTDVAKKLQIPVANVVKVQAMVEASQHKRRLAARQKI